MWELGELHSKLYALEQWLEEAESQRAELEDNLRIVDSKAERVCACAPTYYYASMCQSIVI